jgi:hypothetical protein
MTYGLNIKKNPGGDWIVAPETVASTVKPGDKVVWTLQAPAGTAAHLQFCDDIFEASSALDAHWVSVIDPTQTLELTVASKALPDPRVRRRTYSYAVAVVDSGGMTYAIGSNPPPDLDVGD